jgi:hypothetical protein
LSSSFPNYSSSAGNKVYLFYISPLDLLSHNPQADEDRDPLDIVTDEAEPDVLQTELVHRYLPKLADTGYITWDRTTNEISKGPNWDEIAPLLELIHNHQDNFSAGWL